MISHIFQFSIMEHKKLLITVSKLKILVPLQHKFCPSLLMGFFYILISCENILKAFLKWKNLVRLWIKHSLYICKKYFY